MNDAERVIASGVSLCLSRSIMALSSDSTLPPRASQEALRAKSKDPRSGAVPSRPVAQSAQVQTSSNAVVILLIVLIAVVAGVGVLNAVANTRAAMAIDPDAEADKARLGIHDKSIQALDASITKLDKRQMKVELDMERQAHILEEIQKYIHDKR